MTSEAMRRLRKVRSGRPAELRSGGRLLQRQLAESRRDDLARAGDVADRRIRPFDVSFAPRRVLAKLGCKRASVNALV